MKERCALCSSSRFKTIRTELRDGNTKYKVSRCANCDHIQLLPRPTDVESKEFYDQNLQDKGRGKKIDPEELRVNSRYDTERHVCLIEKLCPSKDCRVLDIGTGYGFFLAELSRRGFTRVMGIEISEERRAMARRLCSAPVIDYDINDPKEDIGRFEIITLFHVLEHVAEPSDFLRRTGELLSPGGVLVAEVPNVDEMLLETCQAYNDFYWIRAHVHYFSRKTLLDCFSRAGFDDVEVRFEQRYGLINLCNWLLTGKPQIERPVFTIDEAYREVETCYRQFVEKQGKSDTLVALARKIK